MERRYLPGLVGRGYADFWRCRKRYRVVKGGKASKKSSTAALWFIYHLMKYPGTNLLVVRRVGQTHRDSTFAQLKWAITRLGADRLWQAVEHPLELRYRPTGQKILFRGMDNVDKLASATVADGCLCWVWIEEAYEIESEADFDRLDLSVPRGEVPPPLFKQTTLTFNPWSGTHWLRRRFFEREQENVLTMTTNYLLNEFLDEADRAVFEEMKRRQPRRYAVAGLGEWGVCEGLVFHRWRVEDFDREALKREKHLRHVFGLDYGYTNDPTAFIALAEDRDTGRLYVYDEHYQRKMLNRDIAAMLLRRGYGKEKIRADSAEPKSNDDLKRLGIRRLTPAAKGRDSVLHGIARLQEYEILVHPACIHTAAELAAYRWKTDSDGTPGNYPEDANNHLIDAMRYAMEELSRCPARGEHPAGTGRILLSAGISAEDMKGGWNAG
ncbi:MAG: PBSX family phage terminase large subunit [Clostridiales bacterium]|nr:PBSX family phage terminase large subunit [Clostridiales bacterium]